MNDSRPSNSSFVDDAALEAFMVSAYDEHHAAVFAFLARSTRQRSLAEDLLRETYIRVAKDVGGEHTPLEVRRVLFRVASNLVLEHSTGKIKGLGRPARPRGKEHPIAPLLEAQASSPDLPSDLDRALDGLSVDARVALLLSGEGFTGDEIAAAIGRSVAATRALLSLARTRVRVRRELFAAGGR